MLGKSLTKRDAVDGFVAGDGPRLVRWASFDAAFLVGHCVSP